MKKDLQPRTTLRDVARRAGVSVSAASDTLRQRPGYGERTRLDVAKAAVDLGYRPNRSARQLRGARSGLLAILAAAENPEVNLDRVAAIERLAHQRGYHCLLGQIWDGPRALSDYVEDVLARDAEGLIWLHQPLTPASRVNRSEFDRVGALIALDAAPAPHADVVQIDYAAGIETAIRHLYRSGRRRIGLALAGRGTGRHPLAQRLQGYLKTVKSLELPSLTWFGHMTTEPSPEDAAAAIAQLVEQDAADALIASNDVWAVRLIQTLRRQGRRTPDDVAVIGFDNLKLAAFCDPSLTTLDQDHEAFAKAALDRLEARIQGGAPESGPSIITPRLILRESAP